MKVRYKNYKIPINFTGWKEIKIPYSDLGDNGGDLSQVTSLKIHSSGWGQVPNKDAILFIDRMIIWMKRI